MLPTIVADIPQKKLILNDILTDTSPLPQTLHSTSGSVLLTLKDIQQTTTIGTTSLFTTVPADSISHKSKIQPQMVYIVLWVVLATVQYLEPTGIIGLHGNSLNTLKMDDFFSKLLNEVHQY